MSTKESLSTFYQLSGSIDSRIQQSTGLKTQPELLASTIIKNKKIAVDLLIPSTCSENCGHCFFVENNLPFLKADSETLNELRKLAQIFDPQQTYLTIYPREITTAMELLPIFTQLQKDTVLTNGALLSERIISQLKNAGITKLSVSLHGNQDQQTKLTQADPKFFELTLQGINRAIKAGMDVSTFTSVSKINVDSLDYIFDLADQLGIKETKLIKLKPAGRAQNLPKDIFIDQTDLINMLYSVNAARLKYENLRISLFGLSFGPNFFSKGLYKYLSGQTNRWPASTFLCPWIGQDFLGISLGSKKIYPCFEALSFPELQIGSVENNQINLTQPPLNPESLQKKLTGICSSANCEYQKLCLGGCRISAFGFAKLNNQENPIFSGQDICLTKTLSQLNN
ncbi:hypothetical protein AUK18_02290 [Candidatus Beckwithbacteria bacterium CG2_30_44_31]|uniref:Radical SAM core domain-containing protein n=1 Tax=Candidatus Beckwithbacteria bacterium CG2_30_44_31 TaxID=1805035 RepID=A0A1J5B8J3_9BACT|nr:MAG: hypothetical protein AUK18_02290 [Candidatus Beckwithbacteria bacterium CG2_30_44_31]